MDHAILYISYAAPPHHAHPLFAASLSQYCAAALETLVLSLGPLYATTDFHFVIGVFGHVEAHCPRLRRIQIQLRDTTNSEWAIAASVVGQLSQQFHAIFGLHVHVGIQIVLEATLNRVSSSISLPADALNEDSAATVLTCPYLRHFAVLPPLDLFNFDTKRKEAALALTRNRATYLNSLLTWMSTQMPQCRELEFTAARGATFAEYDDIVFRQSLYTGLFSLRTRQLDIVTFPFYHDWAPSRGQDVRQYLGPYPRLEVSRGRRM
ncbi:hypothetical protein BDZ89DRAFT_1055600 [Hymenopellis radicata]|nr:hypothetical protein BDZ89DRAFT_1055600 [Hymenopellis radicata]